MLLLKCPHCRKKIKAPPAVAGRKAACPHCRELFQVGTPPNAATRSKSARVDRLIVILGSIAGLLLLVFAVLLFMLLRASPTPKADEPPSVPQHVPQILPRVTPPKSQAKEPPPKPAAKPEAHAEEPNATEAEAFSQVVARLNEMRRAAGLGAVTMDVDLSRGCQAHADYVIAHFAELDDKSMQSEDPARAGFSDEGQKAARASMLAFVEPAKAIDVWLARLNSRSPLLHPDLQRLGVGAKAKGKQWVCVVDPTRGHGSPPPVAYPAPDQKKVPLSFSGGPEVTDTAAGFPVSLQFATNKSPTAITALLTDDAGNRVPVATSTPETPLPGVRRPGLIGMIPRQALAPKTRYKARITGDLDGKPFAQEWSFTTEDDGDDDGVMAAKMLDRINRIRRQAELNPVKLDAELSKACRLHAKYLVVNARRPEVQGMGAHREDAKLPGYSAEGEKAAKASDIALGDYEPTDALDGWMATLYHRVPILEPELREIGFGCARGRRLGWVTVLDVASRRDPGRSRPIFWPVDRQTDVPLNFPPGGETPNPIPDEKVTRAGYPITAFFPGQLPVLKSQARLEDAEGKNVPCWFSSKEAPANPKFVNHQGNTICLIPKEPLRAETTYRVTITGEHLGDAWKKSWTFTTAKAAGASDEAARAAIERLNFARKSAGIGAVMLDPALSAGCQAHADYLVRNQSLRGTKGFSLVDEDAALPGYTAAGQASAKRGDVFWLAPTSATQIDDLLGTLYRRSFALDPRLRRVGLGCAHEVGQGWINVLDLNSGRDDGAPVVFPGAGQEAVPREGRDKVPGETVSGYPITVWFPGRPKIDNVQASVAEAGGATIDIRLSTPTQPFDAKAAQPNVIAIHPLRPLRPNRAYSVNISAEINGVPWRHSSRFATGSP